MSCGYRAPTSERTSRCSDGGWTASKSRPSADTLKRLPRQVVAYGRLFDRCTAVIADRHRGPSRSNPPGLVGDHHRPRQRLGVVHDRPSAAEKSDDRPRDSRSAAVARRSNGRPGQPWSRSRPQSVARLALGRPPARRVAGPTPVGRARCTSQPGLASGEAADTVRRCCSSRTWPVTSSRWCEVPAARHSP